MTVDEEAAPETPLSIFTVLRSPSVLLLLGVMVLWMAAGSADLSYLYTRFEQIVVGDCELILPQSDV